MNIKGIPQENNICFSFEATQKAQRYSATIPSTRLTKDIVEINGKDKKKLSKTSKILLNVLIFTSVIGTAIFCRDKVKANKRITEEAKRIAEKNRQRAHREVQHHLEKERIVEEARIAAEKAQKEAAVRAEKLRLEKIEKEKIEAKIREHRANIQKIIDEFDEQFNLDRVNYEKFHKMIFETSTNDFADAIVQCIKRLEDCGASKEEIEKVLDDIFQKINKLDEAKFSSKNQTLDFYFYDFADNEAKHTILKRKDLVREIQQLRAQIPKNDNETISEYFVRILNFRKAKIENQKIEHIKAIESKIRFTDEVPDMTLTDDELKILQEAMPSNFVGKTKDEAVKILERLSFDWVSGYTDDMMITHLPEEVEHIMLSKAFPRYESQKPVARWIALAGHSFVPDNDVDKYVEETFQVGKKYVVPRLQSCSKNLRNSGDTYYHDGCINWDAKFVIYPKGKVSRAANIGLGKYGGNEVIYPKKSEFMVLDKRLEEVEYNGKKVFRWIITLQEA